MKPTNLLKNIASHIAKPPSVVLTSYRAFPSLEPLRLQPVASQVLLEPLRRDILWQAVTFERDAARVGSKTILGRSDMGYSRKKLRPQKGSGRARVGDRGSPTRHDGGRAFARIAPFDWSTDLPKKIYSKAMRIALSHHYAKGSLYICDGAADFVSGHEKAGELFLNEHNLQTKSIAVVVDEFRENLHTATEKHADKVEIIAKEGVQVGDLLRPNVLIVEAKALEYLAQEFAPEVEIRNITPSDI